LQTTATFPWANVAGKKLNEIANKRSIEIVFLLIVSQKVILKIEYKSFYY